MGRALKLWGEEDDSFYYARGESKSRAVSGTMSYESSQLNRFGVFHVFVILLPHDDDRCYYYDYNCLRRRQQTATTTTTTTTTDKDDGTTRLLGLHDGEGHDKGG